MKKTNKNSMNTKKHLTVVTICVFSLACFLGRVFAWDDPTKSPPQNNTLPPVNVSSTNQTKAGNLNIGGGQEYWITKDGDSFALKNSSNVENFILGQNGFTGISLGSLTPDTTAKLDLNGQIRIRGGVPGAGKVLTSDANGLSAWQTPASGSIGGGGTINYLSKFTGVSAIGNSQIFDNGTNVGIGKNNPAGKLDINATDALFILGENVLSHISGGSTYLKAPSGQTIAFQIPSGTNVASIDSTGVSAPAFYYTSDRRLKKNIRPIDGSLEKIGQLDGVYFDWIKDDSPSMGLIAQDVEKTFPEAVITNPQSGLESVDYAKIVAPLVEAVKNQQQQIEELKSEIKTLKSRY